MNYSSLLTKTIPTFLLKKHACKDIVFADSLADSLGVDVSIIIFIISYIHANDINSFNILEFNVENINKKVSSCDREGVW